MIRMIVSLSVNDYQLLSAAALDMYSRIYGDADVREVYVIECLRVIRESPSSELRARCLEFLFAKSAAVGKEAEATLL
jgi:hypothetical protein